MKRYSIKDVAKIANVSISTVSHALNNSRYVKKETKEKIQEVVNILNYKPSKIAAALRRKTINLIAVSVATIESQFSSKLIIGINKVALENDFHTILVNNFYDKKEEEKIIESIKNQFIDGIVFVSGLDNNECINNLYNYGLPFVLIGRKVGSKYPHILVDNCQASRKVIKFLTGFNHKKIGYLTMTFNGQTTLTERFKGYKEGLEEQRIPYNSEYVVIGDTRIPDEMQQGYILCSRHFKNAEVPTALFCATDNLAAGAYSYFKERGFKIPSDISIFGFDNLPVGKFLEPPLTTMNQPKEEMGELGMQMLINILRKKESVKKSILLETNIIKRKSVTYPSSK